VCGGASCGGLRWSAVFSLTRIEGPLAAHKKVEHRYTTKRFPYTLAQQNLFRISRLDSVIYHYRYRALSVILTNLTIFGTIALYYEEVRYLFFIRVHVHNLAVYFQLASKWQILLSHFRRFWPISQASTLHCSADAWEMGLLILRLVSNISPPAAEILTSENRTFDRCEKRHILHTDSECENQVLTYLLIVPMTPRWRPYATLNF